MIRSLALLALFVLPAHATEVAYINSSAILQEMPEVKRMRSDLEALRAQLQKQGQQMVEAFQAKQNDAAEREERGELSPIDKEKLLKELQSHQEKILEFEKEMQERLGKKEQELLEPILKRVNTAIKKTAEEKGIEMVLESSVLIYGDESLDLTDAVKANL